MLTTFAHAGHDHFEGDAPHINTESPAPEMTTATSTTTIAEHTAQVHTEDFSAAPFIIGAVTVVVVTFAIFCILFMRSKSKLHK
jgi:hypothetical protein